ncbi:CDP-alcohol phosphatidyltransferase family protein [Neisseriaceae bacterium ESL0693]|nr:CDP-alcohol phosphatidyltransferase family protein [Neisseriaceae bacterium ESL0693]
MTLYQIKPAFQKLLRPLMFRLANKGITANHITLSAMALSFITGILLCIWPIPELFWLLPVVLLIRMALNALDGMLARECNQQTKLGAILNELGDILSDTALYLPFALLIHSNAALVLIMIFGAALTEFCGVLAQTMNNIRSYAGPMGKSDRALILGTWGLIITFRPHLTTYNNLVWGIIIVLLIWTIINRCRSVYQNKA